MVKVIALPAGTGPTASPSTTAAPTSPTLPRALCGAPTFRGDELFVRVSDFGRIVRIPVKGDGAPGAQLHENPKVEVCFYNGAVELPEAQMMRLTGAVEFVDDAELVRKVSAKRAALEGIIGRPLEPITEVFRIASGEARFWTLMDILKEPELETIRF
jgi:hypothetical protein